MFVTAGLLVAMTGAVRAQDDSLKIIPAKSPIVVQLNGFEKAQNSLAKFLGNAVPDLAPKLAKDINDAISELAKGRDLKSIDKDGRIYFVVTTLDKLTESPQLAWLVPVTSFKEFKDGFLNDDERKSLKAEGDGIDSAKFADKEEPVYLASKKNYAVIATDKEVAKLFLAKDEKGLDTLLSKETTKSFLAQDMAVYANLKEINREYGAQIRAFKLLIEPLLQQGGAGIDKKQMEAAKQMINAALSLLDDGAAVVLGVEFRPEGANLHFLTQFASDSETNDLLKKFKPAPLKEIGSLPGGQLLYSASNFDPWASKTISALVQMQLADDENPDVQAILKKCFKELSENGRITEVSAFSSLKGSLEVSEYKDGGKAFQSQMNLFKALTNAGSFGGLPFKEKPVIKENVETVGDIKLSNVQFAFDFDKAVEKLPEAGREAAKAGMMRMADDVSSIWIGHTGNKVIQVAAKDFKTAKAMLEDYLAGRNALTSDDAFQTTRKQLPADATMLFVGDTSRVIELLISLVKDQLGAAGGIPGIPVGIPDLKAPKGKPAYSGIALTFKSEYVTFDMFVPVVAVQQVRKMLAPLIDRDN
jgi:hypothetical protein